MAINRTTKQQILDAISDLQTLRVLEQRPRLRA